MSNTDARNALAAHTKLLAELNAKTAELTLAAKLEQEKADRINARAEWEREVVLSQEEFGDAITAVATYPSGAVLPVFAIGVGHKGTLLAIYVVTQYRSKNLVELKSYFPGQAPPAAVELAVMRRWNLTRVKV